LVAVICAEAGIWHRPFTTLELAALQSLLDRPSVAHLRCTIEGGAIGVVGI
jgi:hypothetical protein